MRIPFLSRPLPLHVDEQAAIAERLTRMRAARDAARVAAPQGPESLNALTQLDADIAQLEAVLRQAANAAPTAAPTAAPAAGGPPRPPSVGKGGAVPPETLFKQALAGDVIALHRLPYSYVTAAQRRDAPDAAVAKLAAAASEQALARTRLALDRDGLQRRRGTLPPEALSPEAFEHVLTKAATLLTMVEARAAKRGGTGAPRR